MCGCAQFRKRREAQMIRWIAEFARERASCRDLLESSRRLPPNNCCFCSISCTQYGEYPYGGELHGLIPSERSGMSSSKMKSHLTRRVFHSILANEPIVHRECLRRRAFGTTSTSIDRSSTPAARRYGFSIRCQPQRRTFFNLGMFGGKRKEVREADLDPGLEVMQELERRQRMRARLPPPEDVADALSRFFHAKYRQKQGLTDNQARLAYEGMKYYLESGESTEVHRTIQKPSLLKHAAGVLGRVTRQQPVASHADLALLVLNTAWKFKVQSFQGAVQPANAYVSVLTRCGRTIEARDFVRTVKPENGTPIDHDAPSGSIDQHVKESQISNPVDVRQLSRMWRLVLLGFTTEGKRSEVMGSLEEIQRCGLDAEQMAPPAMLEFCLQDDDPEVVKLWFWKYWRTTGEDPQGSSRGHTILTTATWISRVLSWCIRHKQLALGHEIVREVLADNPPKPFWDAILVWAAGTGKGADEIDRMLGVMEASSGKSAYNNELGRPDIATINGLVEFAITKNDPYLAERFIAVGKQRNIQPDARTYVLQMQYRLKVNDIDGALVAYTNLQSMDISDNEDVPTVNELIVALCNSKRHDFDTIMHVTADLSDRRTRFAPSTVSSLALLHLNRDEVHDVLDLLNTHANHYSSKERKSIKNAVFDFCVDSLTPTSRAWDGYTILRTVFDEIPRSQRTDLMVSFFQRERPDMATHVFSGMRTHSRADTLPTIDTYVAAFIACAKLREIDVLEVIHNQLKLDFNIDPTTYLYNALIISYTACGKPRRALEFWDDIVASKEGPTYNSIHIALRACEKAAFGDVKAQEIWRRLRQTSVELDQTLWASYAGALVGNGGTELAITAIEEAEAKGEVEVDAHIVGSLLTGCPGQAKQDEIEAWAKQRYPLLWPELEKIGIESDDTGLRSVKIERTVTP